MKKILFALSVVVPLSLFASDANVETDRYIAWPGQACSYKMGQLKIEEQRRKAEDALGENFDIRYFHDEVLCDGGITLPILENKIDAFITKHKS